MPVAQPRRRSCSTTRVQLISTGAYAGQLPASSGPTGWSHGVNHRGTVDQTRRHSCPTGRSWFRERPRRLSKGSVVLHPTGLHPRPTVLRYRLGPGSTWPWVGGFGGRFGQGLWAGSGSGVFGRHRRKGFQALGSGFGFKWPPRPNGFRLGHLYSAMWLRFQVSASVPEPLNPEPKTQDPMRLSQEPKAQPKT